MLTSNSAAIMMSDQTCSPKRNSMKCDGSWSKWQLALCVDCLKCHGSVLECSRPDGADSERDNESLLRYWQSFSVNSREASSRSSTTATVGPLSIPGVMQGQSIPGIYLFAYINCSFRVKLARISNCYIESSHPEMLLNEDLLGMDTQKWTPHVVVTLSVAKGEDNSRLPLSCSA